MLHRNLGQLCGEPAKKIIHQDIIQRSISSRIDGRMDFANDSRSLCKRKRIANRSLYTNESIKWRITIITSSICLGKRNEKQSSIEVIARNKPETNNLLNRCLLTPPIFIAGGRGRSPRENFHILTWYTMGFLDILQIAKLTEKGGQDVGQMFAALNCTLPLSALLHV